MEIFPFRFLFFRSKEKLVVGMSIKTSVLTIMDAVKLLEKLVDVKQTELTQLRAELADAKCKQQSSNRPIHAVHGSLPPITQICMGNMTVHVSRNSEWTSSEVEHTDKETGKTSRRYQTVVEADPKKAYGWKNCHGIDVAKGERCITSSSAEMLLFETDTPLISVSASFIDPECGWHWLTNGYKDIRPVKTPRILLFATRRRGDGGDWVEYPLPALTLFRHVV